MPSPAGATATAPDVPGASTQQPVPGSRGIAAVLALAVGIFILVTIEELPIGVLSVMAPDLGVSSGIAGLTVTLPGILAGVVALLTPVITRGIDRRTVLMLALCAVAVSCGLSMVAPNIALLLAARLFAGVAIGLYWAVLPVVAVRQLPPHRSALALTIAFSGTGGALVLGVPLSSWIGAHLGWRQSFAVVGLAALVVLVLLRLLVHPTRTGHALGIADLRAAARTPGVRYAVCLTAVIITGHFITYSYVSPLLADVGGVPVASISLMLLAFGIAGLVGNFAVGPVLRRSPGLAVLIIGAGMAVSLVAILLVVRTPLAAALVMPLWGLFAGAASVSIQAFVTQQAGEHEEAGTALNSAMFNVAIALGAFIGGRIVDASDERTAAVTSLVMVCAGAAIALRWLLRPRAVATAA